MCDVLGNEAWQTVWLRRPELQEVIRRTLMRLWLEEFVTQGEQKRHG